MFPENFTLLENEGFLMQGCFKSSLAGLRAAASAEPGPFYAAFFNYAIGLERLLKVLLLLDRWHLDRKFLDNPELKQYGGKSGHNVAMLHDPVRKLFPKYSVEWKKTWDLDDISHDILSFLADFANGSRYFNLDKLAGTAKSVNPVKRWETLLYRVYAKDVPKKEPYTTKTVGPVPDLDTLSLGEFAGHHALIAASSPYMCCRLVQLLVPLQELLIAIVEQVHKDDLAKDGPDAEPSVPYMEEFLDFVTGDKSIILNDEDWP